jgi:hypothetical protein
MDSIQLVQDRDQWRTFVNAIMNLKSMKRWEFLD